MKKKIIAAALAAAVLLAAGGLLFGLHRIGETTISAGPEPAAPEEVQPPSRRRLPFRSSGEGTGGGGARADTDPRAGGRADRKAVYCH